jgi:tetratricopeptide (TPR) repeat protein
LSLREQGNRLLGERKYEEALKSYEEALDALQRESGIEQSEKQTRTMVSLLNNKALVFLKMSEWARCIDECELVLSLDKSNVKALMRRGNCFQKLKNWRRAKRDYEAVIEQDPKCAEAKETLAKIKASVAEIKEKTISEMVVIPLDNPSGFNRFLGFLQETIMAKNLLNYLWLMGKNQLLRLQNKAIYSCKQKKTTKMSRPFWKIKLPNQVFPRRLQRSGPNSHRPSF